MNRTRDSLKALVVLSFVTASVTTFAIGGPLCPRERQGRVESVLWIQARRVYTVSSQPIEEGEILVRGERIVAVGRDLKVPGEAKRLVVKGSVVPGFIDGGSTIAVRGRAAEEFWELTPQVRTARALDMDDRVLSRALLAGVTAAAVTPGDRNVLGGLGSVIWTVRGNWSSSFLRADAFLSVCLTRAAVAGNRSLRYAAPYTYYHRFPTTRMGTVFLVRRALFEALDMAVPEGLALPGESSLASLLTPEGKRILGESARGKRPIRIRADDKQEIEAALRISGEFQTPIVLEGIREGVRQIPEIAARKIPVLILPGAPVPGGPAGDDRERVLDLGRRLEEAGLLFGFFSERGRSVPELRERVAADIRFGLSESGALKALTLNAARILGIEDQVGSIEPGKRADLVALDGEPFAITSRVQWVLSGGEIWRDSLTFPGEGEDKK